MEFLLAILEALLLTEVIELTAAAFIRAVGILKMSYPDLLIPVFLVNLLTNPLLNYLLTLTASLLGASAVPAATAIGELAVLFGEALLLKTMCRMKFPPALLLSLVLNSASYLSGLLIF